MNETLDKTLEKVVKIGMLFDFYGNLLTDKQQNYFSMYYLQDFSLKEIAEQFKVSRQSVHDILKRTEQVLNDYEEKLGLLKNFTEEEDLVLEIYDKLKDLPSEVKKIPEIEFILNKIENSKRNTF